MNVNDSQDTSARYRDYKRKLGLKDFDDDGGIEACEGQTPKQM